MSEYRSLVKKDGDKYRVFYSYISPKDGKRHRTCKRGFKLRKDADKWAANELPALIRKLEQTQSDTEGMTMSELIEAYLEDATLQTCPMASVIQATQVINLKNPQLEHLG